MASHEAILDYYYRGSNNSWAENQTPDANGNRSVELPALVAGLVRIEVNYRGLCSLLSPHLISTMANEDDGAPVVTLIQRFAGTNY